MEDAELQKQNDIRRVKKKTCIFIIFFVAVARRNVMVKNNRTKFWSATPNRSQRILVQTVAVDVL